MTADIDHYLRGQLRWVMREYESRLGELDPTDPLAPNTAARHRTSTRTLLRNLRSTAPIGSPLAEEIEAAERRLGRA